MKNFHIKKEPTKVNSSKNNLKNRKVLLYKNFLFKKKVAKEQRIKNAKLNDLCTKRLHTFINKRHKSFKKCFTFFKQTQAYLFRAFDIVDAVAAFYLVQSVI